MPCVVNISSRHLNIDFVLVSLITTTSCRLNMINGHKHARWEAWKNRFMIFVKATGVMDEGQKRALLLQSAGPEVRDIARTLSAAQTRGATINNLIRQENCDQRVASLHRHYTQRWEQYKLQDRALPLRSSAHRLCTCWRLSHTPRVLKCKLIIYHTLCQRYTQEARVTCIAELTPWSL